MGVMPAITLLLVNVMVLLVSELLFVNRLVVALASHIVTVGVML